MGGIRPIVDLCSLNVVKLLTMPNILFIIRLYTGAHFNITVGDKNTNKDSKSPGYN